MESSKPDWNDKQFRSEYFKKYNSEYYQLKKDLLCTKVNCDCGKVVNLSSLKRHLNSSYHKNNLMSQKEKLEVAKAKIKSSAS